ncbi:MAG TPA: hypothetical protein VGL40_06680 [Bacillota bacterium]
MKRVKIVLMFSFIVGMLAASLWELTRSSEAQATALAISTLSSPNGMKVARLSVLGQLDTDGTAVFTVDGLTSHSGVNAVLWAQPSSDLLQWIDDTHYLLGGTTVIEADTGNTEPLPLTFKLTYLGYAVSPDHTSVAVAVKNYDTGTGQIWVIPFGGAPLLLFDAPLSGRVLEPTVSLAWGPNRILYFDFMDDKTSRIHRSVDMGSPEVLVDNAACPQPSKDGRFLALTQTDQGGRGFRKAIVDASNGQVKRADLPVGVVTWSSVPGMFGIHFGRRIAAYRLGRDAPVAEVDLPGLVACLDWSGEGIQVTAIDVEGVQVRRIEQLNVPIPK